MHLKKFILAAGLGLTITTWCFAQAGGGGGGGAGGGAGGAGGSGGAGGGTGGAGNQGPGGNRGGVAPGGAQNPGGNRGGVAPGGAQNPGGNRGGVAPGGGTIPGQNQGSPGGNTQSPNNTGPGTPGGQTSQNQNNPTLNNGANNNFNNGNFNNGVNGNFSGFFPSALYSFPDVATSMNLTQDQVTRLNQLTQQLQNRYATDLQQFSSLPADQRQARMQDLLTRYQSDWTNTVGGVFTPQQLSRYQQLQLQYQGFDAFMSPDVQRRLNLTDAQMQQLRDLIQWNQQQLQDINRMGATNREQAMQLWQNYQTQLGTRLNSWLTPQQQQLWQGMIGEQFRFQPNFATAQPTAPVQPRR